MPATASYTIDIRKYEEVEDVWNDFMASKGYVE